jgi:hypothetical protein
MVQAYARSLLFLGLVTRHRQSPSKWVPAPFRLEDTENHVKSLADAGGQLARAAEDCEKHCNHENRSMIKELYELAGELRQLHENQAYVSNPVLWKT